MALQRQTVGVSFGGGVDTKTDPFQISPGKLAVLENGVLQSPKRVQKRPGYGSLGSIGAPGQMVASHRNGLVAAANWQLAALHEHPDRYWRVVGSLPSAHLEYRVLNAHRESSLAIHEGARLACFVSRNPLWGAEGFSGESSNEIVIFDIGTGETRTRIRSIEVGDHPRVIATSEHFCVFGVRNGGLELAFHRIHIDDTFHGDAVVDTSVTGHTDSRIVFDVIAAHGAVFVAYARYSGSELELCVRRIEEDGTVGERVVCVSRPGNLAPTGRMRPFCIIASNIATPEEVAVLFTDGPADDKWTIGAKRYTGLLEAIGVGVVAADLQVDQLVSVSGVYTDFTTVRVHYTHSPNAVLDPPVTSRFRIGVIEMEADQDQIVWGESTDVFWGMALAGKTFHHPDYGILIPAAHFSNAHETPGKVGLQNTYFLLTEERDVVARGLAGRALRQLTARYGETGSVYGVPDLTLPTLSLFEDRIYWPVAAFGNDQAIRVSEGGSARYGVGSGYLRISPADERAYQKLDAGGALHVGGGNLMMYDGANVVEHGFHLFPEGLVFTEQGGENKYFYSACYRWHDATGRVHRSKPTPRTEYLTVAPISSTNKIQVSIPTLRLTKKTGVTIELYRTTAADEEGAAGPLHLVGEVGNFPTGDLVEIWDGVSDDDLASRPMLYTESADGAQEEMLGNRPCVPCEAMCAHARRVFVVDAENPTRIHFSREIEQGQPVEFGHPDLFSLMVNERMGSVTALGSMAENLVVFRRHGLSCVIGRGPNAIGVDNDFTEVADNDSVGCANQRSIVEIPAGLMFQSAKGIYLLGRDLSVSYVGADVEAYNSDVVTSAVKMPGTTRVRFTSISGRALDFDYLTGQWSVMTGLSTMDAAVHNNKHVLVRPNGALWREEPIVASDDGQFVKLKLTIPWVAIAGVQGAQRIYRILLLGQYIDPHALTVKLAYDYDPTIVETLAVTPASGAYQWEVRPARQQCEAIQITIEDSKTTAASARLSLSNLALEVGIKPNLWRMAVAQRMT